MEEDWRDIRKQERLEQSLSGGVDGVEPKKILDRKNISAIAMSEEELLLISEQNEVNPIGEESTWVVDSGASFHVTPAWKYFSSYKSGDHDLVKMGNDGACRIVGIGDVCLMTSTGCKLVLRDVRHVPEVQLNLISANQLDDEGYTHG